MKNAKSRIKTMLSRALPTLLLFAMAVLSGLEAVSILAHPTFRQLMLPLGGSLLAGVLVSVLLRKLNIPLAVAIVSGSAVAVATALLVIDPSTVSLGPHAIIHRLSAQLDVALHAIPSPPSGFATMPGVVFVDALAISVPNIAAFSIWVKRTNVFTGNAPHGQSETRHGQSEALPFSSHPALAAVPSFVLLCTAIGVTGATKSAYAIFYGQSVSSLIALAYLTVAAAFLATTVPYYDSFYVARLLPAAPSTTLPSPAPAPSTQPSTTPSPETSFILPRLRGSLAAISVWVVLIIVVALSVPGLYSALASGNSKSHPGIPPGSTTANQYGQATLQLEDNLLTMKLTLASTVMFTASASAPTYWQVGTLSYFNGTQWLATGPGVSLQDYQRYDQVDPSSSAPISRASPLNQPYQDIHFSPSGAGKADITITGLVSSLLPVPPYHPHPSGVRGIKHIDGMGFFLSSGTIPGMSYHVIWDTPTTTGRNDRQSSHGKTPAAHGSPYLILPREPAAVVALAHKIIRGDHTEESKVASLLAFFRSGNFHYSLSAPVAQPHKSDSSGSSSQGSSNPLVSFLFDTHSGYCQQFAGAFGVMARLDGVATRIAVGFTTGSQVNNTSYYTVTGMDAHVWPEVYMGALGWVSVEPTPGIAVSSPAAKGVISYPLPRYPHTTTPPSSPVTPATIPANHIHPAAPGTVKRRSHTGSKTPHRAPAGSIFTFYVIIGIIILAVAVIALLGAVTLRRRCRRGSHVKRGIHSNAIVFDSWISVERSLHRSGFEREPNETPLEYARRIGLPEMESLTLLVYKAHFSAEDCTDSEAGTAKLLSSAIAEKVRVHSR